MSKGQDYFFKGALIGSPGVGKTSILNVLTGQQFEENYLNTVGVDFKNLFFQIDGKSVKLQLWDTAGQEKFRSMSTMVYKGADLIMAVFDMTDQRTFHALLNDWLDEVGIYSEYERCIIVIIGNKQDSNQKKLDIDFIEGSLKNSNNLYSLKDGEQGQGEQFGYIFEQVSAKTNFNIQETVQKALSHLAKRKKYKKINAKKERDFGQSNLIINGKNLESKIPKQNKCCKSNQIFFNILQKFKQYYFFILFVYKT